MIPDPITAALLILLTIIPSSVLVGCLSELVNSESPFNLHRKWDLVNMSSRCRESFFGLRETFWMEYSWMHSLPAGIGGGMMRAVVKTDKEYNKLLVPMVDHGARCCPIRAKTIACSRKLWL
jgi:hypothetical protein